MAGFTVENMNYDNSPEVMKGPESKIAPQVEKELNEAQQALQAHEDAKKTVESTGKVAEKEMKEAGILINNKDTGSLELSEMPDPLSKKALENRLEGNLLNKISKDGQMQEELKYALTPKERIKNINPETAKQIQIETGENGYT